MRRTHLALIALVLAGIAFGQDSLRELATQLRTAQALEAKADAEAKSAQTSAIRYRNLADEMAVKARTLRAEASAAAGVTARTQDRFNEALRAFEEPVIEPDPPGGGPYERPEPDPPEAGRFARFDAHDAAGRTAAENKLAYLPALRATRSTGAGRTSSGERLFGQGQAPDVGDVDIFVHWQKGMSVSRHHRTVDYAGDVIAKNVDRANLGQPLLAIPGPGQVQKTGNVDVARVTFQPHPTWLSTPKNGKQPFNPRTNMRWGMRRYNLGDSTVIDCDFTDIPEEHGIYDDLAGHGLYEGLTFLRLGAQSLQICSRDQPYAQYPADNMPYTGKPTIVVENCHTVDSGYFAAKRAFAWTFFDPGTVANPATIVLRDCTWVAAYPPRVEKTNTPTTISDPKAIQASKGLVVTQYDHSPVAEGEYTVEDLVLTNCVFDGTRCEGAPIVIRGVETTTVDHCTFLFRNTRQSWFTVDDPRRGNRSGKLIVQDCLSPTGVTLRIMDQPVMYQGQPFSMHCPGKRFEIDCRTLEVEEVPMSYDRIIDFRSPLEGRGGDLVPSGFTPQPAGAVMDMGTVAPVYRRAG